MIGRNDAMTTAEVVRRLQALKEQGEARARAGVRKDAAASSVQRSGGGFDPVKFGAAVGQYIRSSAAEVRHDLEGEISLVAATARRAADDVAELRKDIRELRAELRDLRSK